MALSVATLTSAVRSQMVSGQSEAPPLCTPGIACTPIQHVVILVKENRSFDSMFGTFPGANGATTFTAPDGAIYPLNAQPDSLLSDVDHGFSGTRHAYDAGKMDRFSQLNYAIQNGVDMADSQLNQSQIPNYWQYARTYAMADNFFSTISGPSFPNHLYTIAGEAANVVDNPSMAN